MQLWNISEVMNGGIGPAPNWKNTTNNRTNTTEIFEEIFVTSSVSVVVTDVTFVTYPAEVSFAAISDKFSTGKQTKITAVDIQLINIPFKIQIFITQMSPTSVIKIDEVSSNMRLNLFLRAIKSSISFFQIDQ